MSQQPLPIGTRSQLFVDDYLIIVSEGLATTLHPMTKHPEPVLQAKAPWERPEVGGLWVFQHALYDPHEGLFKLWYNSYGTYPARNQQPEPIYSCYATSADGLHWERPPLGLFAYEGSTDNNITGSGRDGVPGCNGGLLDCAEMAGLEPPERRYKTAGSPLRCVPQRTTWAGTPSRSGPSRTWCWPQTCSMMRWQRSGAPPRSRSCATIIRTITAASSMG